MYVFYFMLLNAFFWDGVHRFHQTHRAFRGTEKVKNPYSIKTELFTVLHALILRKIHIWRRSRI